MTSVDKQNNDCQEGVCGVNFKPMQAARRSFQNLKALASDLIDKVKDTLSGESHDASTNDSAAGEDQKQEPEKLEMDHLQMYQQHVDTLREENMQALKMQQSTVAEKELGSQSPHRHLSAHSSEILNSFVQNSWSPLTDANQASDTGTHLKMVHVRPRPLEGQREAPRYSNPWRFDSHH